MNTRPLGPLLALAALVGGWPARAEPPAAADAAPLPTGRTVASVRTRHDESQRYALYLPSAYRAADRDWPVLFVLDPRGRAVPGVERFLPAAERHGYIVMSSYQSRSDTLRIVNVEALEALLREAQERYRLDPRRLYLAGMSGTAHAAWRFAQELGEHAAGVIASVGGVQEETQGPPGPASFAYYGIASPIDFNYQEMLELEEHMLDQGIDHRLDFFDGRHGWPPREHTNRALDWMELQAVRRGLTAADGELIEGAYRRAAAALEGAAGPLERLRRHRDLVRDFSGLRDVAAHQAAAGEIEASVEYSARRKHEQRLARQEHTYFAQRLGPLLSSFQRPGRRPPNLKAARAELRLGALARKADSAPQPEARSARRILESVHSALAFYLPAELERAGRHDPAARSLEIAVSIFPWHAGTRWRLAEVLARAGRSERAFEALRAATALGNVDVERLLSDPTWEPLRSDPAWTELLESLGAAVDPARRQPSAGSSPVAEGATYTAP